MSEEVDKFPLNFLLIIFILLIILFATKEKEKMRGACVGYMVCIMNVGHA